MKKGLLTVIFLGAVSGLLFFGIQGGSLQAGGNQGEEVLQERCTTCHGKGRIEAADHDRQGWENTVDRMMARAGFGPELTDAERQALLRHLKDL